MSCYNPSGMKRSNNKGWSALLLAFWIFLFMYLWVLSAITGFGFIYQPEYPLKDLVYRINNILMPPLIIIGLTLFYLRLFRPSNKKSIISTTSPLFFIIAVNLVVLVILAQFPPEQIIIKNVNATWFASPIHNILLWTLFPVAFMVAEYRFTHDEYIEEED